MAFFGHDSKRIKNKRVLDCPSGVSSFVAEAKKQGVNVKGCDIIYQFHKEAIVERGEESIEIIYKDTINSQEFDYSFYGSLAGHKKHRKRALKKFGGDFNAHDYSFQTLPKLSYKDDNFDIVLSSHLLFVYDDRFDYSFHENSIKEMLRVGKEVRLFPLVDYLNSHEGEEQNFSPFVYKIQEKFGGEIIKVDFEFQKGANYMMVIQRGDNGAS